MQTFTRQGDDIHVSLPISVTEAVLGRQVRAAMTTGTVMLTVPKGLQHLRRSAPQR